MPPLLALDLAITIIFFVVMAAALVMYGAVFWSIFRDAPFVPSPKSVAKVMMEIAQVKPGELVVELGSGHGIILFAAAACGARAVGYELSPFLCWATRLQKILWWRHADLRVVRHDLFDADISQAQVVTCYLFPKTMEQLSHKFQAELLPGTRVVSSQFSIPGWTPKQVTRLANRPIYLYEMPQP